VTRGIVPASVVIPTIGRPTLVRSLLESLAACEPRADEVVIVDQSRGDEVARVVQVFANTGVRLVKCERAGVGRARNVALQSAQHDTVLGTDDDCTVGPRWVGRGWEHVQADRRTIATGRVFPVGDPRSVPSTRDHAHPSEYEGRISGFPLFTNNMALSRSLALALGGFDEGLPAAEDNDFGYRWLHAGLRLFYDPEMVVWHYDWRSPEELERLYETYARGQAAFYAKHLRQGDLRMLSFIVRDLVSGLRGLASEVVRGRPPWPDPRKPSLTELPSGLVIGWRAYKPGRDAVAELRRLGRMSDELGARPRASRPRP
jgi:GT2 family glycosyltransferase